MAETEARQAAHVKHIARRRRRRTARVVRGDADRSWRGSRATAQRVLAPSRPEPGDHRDGDRRRPPHHRRWRKDRADEKHGGRDGTEKRPDRRRRKQRPLSGLASSALVASTSRASAARPATNAGARPAPTTARGRARPAARRSYAAAAETARSIRACPRPTDRPAPRAAPQARHHIDDEQQHARARWSTRRSSPRGSCRPSPCRADRSTRGAACLAGRADASERR